MSLTRFTPLVLVAQLAGCGQEGGPASVSTAPPLDGSAGGVPALVARLPLPDEARQARPEATDPLFDAEAGDLVYVDGRDWTGWYLLHPEQASATEAGKWLQFEPLGNIAYSPPFRPVRLFRTTFDLYFPPRFPLYYTSPKANTELFGLRSQSLAPGGQEVRVGVNLLAGSTWRIEAAYRTADGTEWSSGDRFEMPWIFEHGWNAVNLTVLLREVGAHQDAMRIQVGDRIFAWSGLDLSEGTEGFRHFRLGNWDADRGDNQIGMRNLQIEDLGQRDEPPPPPPPPSGTVLFEQNFEGDRPFRNWLGRHVRTNLQVVEQAGNHIGRLIYSPHADWRISFLPRHQGVLDLRAEYAVRLPAGYRYRRYPPGDPREGQIIGGGKHFWMLQSSNQYDEGRDAMMTDGVTRLDFGAHGEFGDWACTSYRNRPGGERPGEFARRFAQGPYFTPGRWHRVRCDLHLNRGPGDNSGRLDLWIDDDHKGTFTGEFNVVGPTGGIRVLGFGNMDNLEGEPWMEVDDIRIEAR